MDLLELQATSSSCDTRSSKTTNTIVTAICSFVSLSFIAYLYSRIKPVDRTTNNFTLWVVSSAICVVLCFILLMLSITSQCGSNNDCRDNPDGKFCIGRKCVKNCEQDSNCCKNERCISGVCVGQSSLGCLTAADCAGGRQCVNNVCVAQDNTTSVCRENTDCSMPTPYCTRGQCVSCVIDANCTVRGQRCINGVCRAP